MGESRRQYDEEFKSNAVELCRTSGKTTSQIARDLGINSSACSEGGKGSRLNMENVLSPA